MKRAVALLLVLAVFGTAGLVCAHRGVGASAGAVEMYETVLEGDRAVAEGVEVQFPMECRTRLHWDTMLRIGAENETETVFSYSREKEDTMKWMSNVPLSLGVSDNIGGEILPEEEHELYAVVSDVASRVPPGTAGGESVRLRDYYEFMPLHVSLAQEMNVTLARGADIKDADVKWLSFFSEELDSAFEQRVRELFAIPVPEEYYLDVNVEKGPGGAVQWSVYPQREKQKLELDCEASPTENGMWVAAQLSGGDGLFSCAGAGKLWYIPAGGESEIICVMELEPGEDVLKLATDALGRALVLICRDGEYYIKAADCGDIGYVQTIELPEMQTDANIIRIYTAENCLVVSSVWGQFDMFELTESGEYVPRLSGELRAPAWDAQYSSSRMVLRWDGRRLVMASEVIGYNSSDMPGQCTGFMLWVFDAEGRSFCAEYVSSLAMAGQTGYTVDFWEKPGLRLH